MTSATGAPVSSPVPEIRAQLAKEESLEALAKAHVSYINNFILDYLHSLLLKFYAANLCPILS